MAHRSEHDGSLSIAIEFLVGQHDGVEHQQLTLHVHVTACTIPTPVNNKHLRQRQLSTNKETAQIVLVLRLWYLTSSKRYGMVRNVYNGVQM